MMKFIGEIDIERVTTTVKTEFVSSTSNSQKLKAQLAKKEKEN